MTQHRKASSGWKKIVSWRSWLVNMLHNEKGGTEVRRDLLNVSF